MTRYIAVLGIVFFPVFAGCGGSSAGSGVAYRPSDNSGKIDKSLRLELQTKQIVLAKVLDALLEEADVGQVAKVISDVHFNESSLQFYEGASQLVRWKFNGAPTGNEVPVVLTLSDVRSPKNQKSVERIYVVNASPDNAFTIVRK